MPDGVVIVLGIVLLLAGVLWAVERLQRQVPREGDPEITPARDDEDCGCG